MNPKHLIVCLIALASVLPFSAFAEFRTFTDTQGREMEAKVTDFRNETVFIKRKDGLSTKVPISIFSQGDQEYVREWSKSKALSNGALKVRFSTNESKGQDKSQGGINYTEFAANYEIIIENTSSETIEGLRVDYLILKFKDELGAKKRSSGDTKRIKDSLQAPAISAREEVRLSTKAFEMLRTELQPGYVWDLNEAGHDPESEDKLKGIWIKVYNGNTLVLEESRPVNMKTKEVW